MTTKTRERHNEPWTKADLRLMRRLASAGESARFAGLVLARSTAAVKYKAMVEGVRFHAINQPRGTQRTRKQRALLSKLTAARHRRRRREQRRAA